MSRLTRRVVLVGVLVWAHLVVSAQTQPPVAPSAEQKAADYLAREVPRWRREHPCYSCHNNGDGTRALVAASARGLADPRAFEDSVAWLRTPARWALNADAGGVKDLPLSRVQFAAALAELRATEPRDAEALTQAAALVMADQRADGSWPISATSNVGTPSGYGTPLATAVARDMLVRADGPAVRAAIARADAWFRAQAPQAVLEASAVLLGLGAADDARAVASRQAALAILAQGQASDGGWGPHTSAPSEPFDTAVAVLALQGLRARPVLAAPAMTEEAWRHAIDRGRAYLRAQQEPDGSWVETTRPSGQESYSQRVSTTAWALRALFP
jgi:hypothetical protein